MKIAVLGDTHFGARNGSQLFHQYFHKFYRDIFFPYLLEHDIKTIIQLGDFWDNRKQVNFTTLHNTKETFLAPLNRYGLEMITILGNHDIVYKDTIKYNSSILFEDHPQVTVISRPTETEYGLLVPWICKENQDDIAAAIEHSSSVICFGHFEFAGFDLFKGHTMQAGQNPDELSKFDKIISGHYHHCSEKKNVLYTGTPYELTWVDCADPKRFYILDTEDDSLTPIYNPYSIFKKIMFDGNAVIDPSDYSDCIVKLITSSTTDSTKLDNLVHSLHAENVAELKIIDDLYFASSDVDSISMDETPNTLDIVDQYIDHLEVDVEKEKIKTFMRELYLEAQASDTA